jgi:hypothetical protein
MFTIGRLKSRRAPLAVTLSVIASGMLYSLAWLPITHHGLYSQSWLTPGDLWASYRTAHWVAWGGHGSLYGATGAYLTFPALALLLALLAALTHMTPWTFQPLRQSHREFWERHRELR